MPYVNEFFVVQWEYTLSSEEQCFLRDNGWNVCRVLYWNSFGKWYYIQTLIRLWMFKNVYSLQFWLPRSIYNSFFNIVDYVSILTYLFCRKANQILVWEILGFLMRFLKLNTSRCACYKPLFNEYSFIHQLGMSNIRWRKKWCDLGHSRGEISVNIAIFS